MSIVTIWSVFPNLVTYKVKEAQRNYEKHLVDNLHVNPRPFYSYIKSKQKVKDILLDN